MTRGRGRSSRLLWRPEPVMLCVSVLRVIWKSRRFRLNFTRRSWPVSYSSSPISTYSGWISSSVISPPAALIRSIIFSKASSAATPRVSSISFMS